MKAEHASSKEARDEAEMARVLMEREVKDLGLQIQHILRQQQQTMHAKRHSGPNPNPNQNHKGKTLPQEDEHFLLYADVGELQSKNESLVRVVRKLELERHKMAEVMEKHGIQADGSLSADRVFELDSVLLELQEMKTSRERTEEMVLGSSSNEIC